MSRPERSFRTQALILRRRHFGEADRLLTLITPDHGKIDAVAKGARKPASKKTGHVELYTRADVLISRGRELDILTQAEMIEPYLPLRENLERGAYASYAAELLDRFTFTGDSDLRGLFALLDETFARLSSDPDPRLATRYYEMHLLERVGFRPELNECVLSHVPITAEDQFFSYVEGGVVSPAAAHQAGQLVALSLPVLKLLRHLQRSPYPQVRELKVTPAQHAEIERIMLGYISYLLESKLQSVDFIRRIRRLAT